MIVSLDIETSCSVGGCPGLGGSSKCNHALEPHTSKIDVVGVTTDMEEFVFRSLSDLKTWLVDYSHGYILELGGHNFKFDYKHLLHHGIDLKQYGNWTWDTQLMAYTWTEKIPEAWLESYSKGLKHGQRKAGQHSLKTLAPYFLGVAPYWETEDKNDDLYVLTDTRYTLQLYQFLKAELEDASQFNFYHEQMMPWARMLCDAEVRGIQLDTAKIISLKKDLIAERDQLQQQLDNQWADGYELYRKHLIDSCCNKYRMMAYKYIESRAKADASAVCRRYDSLKQIAISKLPTKMNLGSPAQLKWLMKNYLKLEWQNDEGEESTGVATLESLVNQGNESLRPFLAWRKANKLLQFIEQFEDAQVNGVIRTHYHVTGTRTGRLSSSDINVQQINKKLKPLFKPRDGYCFVGFDLRSIETALIAAYTENKKLYDIFQSGNSPHNYNVKIFFGLDCPEDDIPAKYPLQRAATKNVGFALFYGAGAPRIKQTFAAKGFMFTDEECSRLLANYKEAYADVFSFHKEITKVFASGETVFNIVGRPIKIQDPQDAYMKGFNTLIQSSASDLCLEGARCALTKCQKLNLEAHPLLFVHDYVGFEVKKECASEVEKILNESMTGFKLVTSHGELKLGVEGGIVEVWE